MPKKQQYRKPVTPAAPPTTEARPRRENPNAVTVDGRVVEALPNAMFTVELEGGQTVLGHLGGKMRKNFIRVLPGDRVVVDALAQSMEFGAVRLTEQRDRVVQRQSGEFANAVDADPVQLSFGDRAHAPELPHR